MNSRDPREVLRCFWSRADWTRTRIWSSPDCGERLEGRNEGAAKRMPAETGGAVADRQRGAFRYGVFANDVWALWQRHELGLELAVADDTADGVADCDGAVQDVRSGDENGGPLSVSAGVFALTVLFGSGDLGDFGAAVEC